MQPDSSTTFIPTASKPIPAPTVDDDDSANATTPEFASSLSSLGSSLSSSPPVFVFQPSTSPLLNPLYFPTHNKTNTLKIQEELVCPVCSFASKDHNLVLEHMSSEHKLKVKSIEAITDFSKYLSKWKQILSASTVAETFAGVAPDADGEFVLGAPLEADMRIREELQKERLTSLLEQQQGERSNLRWSRKCLFCKKVCLGDRAQLFSHMFSVHKFNIGLPDNLVNVSELLDILQSKIDSLQCIYCEKVFKSYSVLKLHMRKKKHFKIDSRNKIYDRFYIVNYLESGKDWKQIQEEEDDNDEEAEEWDDWVEENSEAEPAVCLYCDFRADTPTECLEHLKSSHSFDLLKLKEDWDLDTYGCIKLINYIRRSVYENRCPQCALVHGSPADLRAHFERDRHYSVKRNDPFWNDAQYLFPTYENDSLLWAYTDSDDELETEEQLGLDDFPGLTVEERAELASEYPEQK